MNIICKQVLYIISNKKARLWYLSYVGTIMLVYYIIIVLI